MRPLPGQRLIFPAAAVLAAGCGWLLVRSLPALRQDLTAEAGMLRMEEAIRDAAQEVREMKTAAGKDPEKRQALLRRSEALAEISLRYHALAERAVRRRHAQGWLTEEERDRQLGRLRFQKERRLRERGNSLPEPASGPAPEARAGAE